MNFTVCAATVKKWKKSEGKAPTKVKKLPLEKKINKIKRNTFFQWAQFPFAHFSRLHMQLLFTVSLPLFRGINEFYLRSVCRKQPNQGNALTFLWFSSFLHVNHHFKDKKWFMCVSTCPTRERKKIWRQNESNKVWMWRQENYYRHMFGREFASTWAINKQDNQLEAILRKRFFTRNKFKWCVWIIFDTWEL